MGVLSEVAIRCESVERFAPLLGAERVQEALQEVAVLRGRLGSRIVWNVNSTAVGGGVAEMLRALLPYARGTGVDARWLVIGGDARFFRVTKRLHNALHGEVGDGSPLGDAARATYDATLHANADELLAVVKPRDVVILHDPQTAGLAPVVLRAGARVVWRCHIGSDETNAETARGWAFLAPYLRDLDAYIFTREAYIPQGLPRDRCAIIPPSIDPFAPKNQPMNDAVVRAVLVHVGLIAGPAGDAAPVFRLEDGSPARVDRCADVMRLGAPPSWEAPLVAQVSRWDDLKDPVGVLRGFATLVATGRHLDAQLLLVGPNVRGVADDPDGERVYNDVTAAWRALPHLIRQRVALVSLPTTDVEENAAIVNAVQRHAAVVVQKSLREGFGLTVTEAMWKSRPVIASAVGGIVDQIDDGVDGLLVKDPTDLAAFAEALHRVLADADLARRLGERAHERVREHSLGLRHLLRFAALLEQIDGVAVRAA